MAIHAEFEVNLNRRHPVTLNVMQLTLVHVRCFLMNGDAPEFIEAIRLARQFFPESRGFISTETGIDWDSFLGAMMTADYQFDHSCDPFSAATIPASSLASKGALDGESDDVYLRLLDHSAVVPLGRAVVIPDAIGLGDHSTENCLPFVCHSRTVSERLRGGAYFSGSRDTIFIFESGSAILVDHDDRVHWACSRIRSWRE